MRVLIIGGTGNISTAVTRGLIERGDDIILFNRGQTPAEFEGPYTVIKGDRRDTPLFEEQIASAGLFDCVIDMICYEPKDARALVRAVRGRTKQVILSSTVDAYVKPARRYPVTEREPRLPSKAFTYAYNKVACEDILLEAEQRGDFALTIMRNAHTYNDSAYVAGLLLSGPAFLSRIRNGKPIIVIGDGTSLWSLCHRDDAGPAFVAAVGNPKAYGKAYNVAGEEWMTWETIYQITAKVMGAPSIVPVHIPSDLLAKVAPKMASWCDLNFKYDNIFDTGAVHNDLGFRYTIAWEEGVRRNVDWYDRHARIAGSEVRPLYDRIIGAWEKLTVSMQRELTDIES